MTGLPQAVSGAPTTLTDSIGTQYSIYTDPQGNKYVVYTDPAGTYYLNQNGIKVYLPAALPAAPANTGSTPVTIYIDSTGGNRYILSPSGVRKYLTFVSSTANSFIYADPSGNKYTIYRDPTSNNLYTQTSSGLRTYLTSLPQPLSANPSTFNDTVGTQYAIYSDPQGNRYVTYSDPSGRYYLNSTINKVYVGGAATLLSPIVIYLDGSGNKYVLSNSGERVYLHPVSESSTQAVLADPYGNSYTLNKDPSSGNIYETLGSTKYYLTGYPTQTSGTPVTLNDAVGTVYSIVGDPQGNKYLTYSDSTGKYYYNTQLDPVFLSKTPVNNLSTDDGSNPLWALVNHLQDMLAECQGAMFG